MYVYYAQAGVMARARILLILTRTTRVFLIFVTSAQLINREFLAFPSGNFFKNRLISLQLLYLYTVLFLLKTVRANLLY